MKITDILLEAGTPVYRSADIDEQDLQAVLDVIKANAPDALAAFKANPTWTIWRGISSRQPPVFFQDTHKSVRSAENTHNYVNLLTTVLPSWANVPARSASVSCSSKMDMAISYGRPYVALPCKTATCVYTGFADFWEFCEAGILGDDVSGVATVINHLIYELPAIAPKFFKRTAVPTTGQELMQFLSDVDDAIDSGRMDVAQAVNQYAICRRYLDSNYDSFVEFLNSGLSPNSFRISTDGSVLQPAGHQHAGEEIAVSGTILYVAVDVWRNVIKLA